MPQSVKRLKKFYDKRDKIGKAILKKTQKHETIYGAQALNKQLPKKLRKHTEDYDIYTNTPRKDALEAEKYLDKKFGGDYFYTKKAKHEGTYKVKDRIMDKGVVDYTKPKGNIPSKIIGKHRYVTLDHIEKGAKKTLKDKSSEYRHPKDKDTLNRIKINKFLKKQKRRKKKHGIFW